MTIWVVYAIGPDFDDAIIGPAFYEREDCQAYINKRFYPDGPKPDSEWNWTPKEMELN